MPGLQAIRRFQAGGTPSIEQQAAFDSLVRSGDYAGATQYAANLGYSPQQVADYVAFASQDPNRLGISLPADLTPSGLTQVIADQPVYRQQAAEDQAVIDFINQYQRDPNVEIPYALYAGASLINPLITDAAISRVTGADPGFVSQQREILNQIDPISGYSDAQIGVWLINNPKGPNESQEDYEKRLFKVAQDNNVSADVVARVTGADPGYVRRRQEEIAAELKKDIPIRSPSGGPPPGGNAVPPLQPTAQQGLRSIPQTAILRSPMAMSELVAQPATRPQLGTGIRALDLGTQTFGDLTNLQRGAPVAVDRFPSTAIAGQVNPLRSYIDSLYAAGATDADVAAFGERAGLDPRAFAELFRDVPGTTPGTIQSFYNQLRPQGIYSTVGPNALQSQVNVPTRSFAPPMGDEAIVFRNLPINDQIAAIHNYQRANPNVSPEQLVTDMTRFGVTADLLSRAGPPPPLDGTTPSTSGTGTPATNPALLGPGLEGYVYSASGGRVSLAEGGMPKLSAREAGSQFDISEYIDPETGRFYINEYQRDVVFNPELREAERVARERMTPEEEQAEIEKMLGRFGLPGYERPYERPVRRASGGIIDVIPSKVYSARVPIQLGTPSYAKGGLASIAENLAEKGRGGDTMLVHMAPEEVSGLRALAMQMGGDLSINPQTGLPEAKWLKRLLPLLPFALGPLGFLGKGFLSTLAGKSLLSGAIAGFTAPGKGFNFKEGLKTGLTAFAGGKLFEALGSLGQTPGPAPGTSPPTVNPSMGGVEIAGGPQVPGGYFSSASSGAPSTAAPNPSLTSAPAVGPAEITGVTDVPIAGVGANAPAPTLGSGLKSLAGAAVDAATGAIARNPMTAASLAVSGYGLMEGEKERQAFKAEQAAKDREEEERRRQYAELFSRTLGRIPMAAGGGLVAMAQGGMPTFEYGGTTAPTGEPRMVKGAGDGMSDNVPANIEGVQEARLANDEFVIPADVVADIGNGSSSAGAKKLYAMMDRIRQARHGTTEQPPEIKAERLMPA